MRILLIIWIYFLFVSCTTRDSLYNKATELENQGAFAEAIALLDRLISSDPTYLPAYISRGDDKTELKQYSEAIKDYSYVINHDSTYIVAWVNRGNNKLEVNDYPGALADLKTAMRIREQVYGPVQVILYNTLNDPKDVRFEEIHLSRGIAYWYADSIKQAYHDFNSCINQNYEVIESLYWRAYTYWKAGDEAKAYLDFLSVIRLGGEEDSRVAEAKNNLTRLNVQKENK